MINNVVDFIIVCFFKLINCTQKNTIYDELGQNFSVHFLLLDTLTHFMYKIHISSRC